MSERGVEDVPLPGDEVDIDLDDDEDDEEQVNPYEIPMTSCDVIFTTRVSQISSLGEAAETTALNIIRNGLDSYYILFTDLETGEQYISEGGQFVRTPDDDTNA